MKRQAVLNEDGYQPIQGHLRDPEARAQINKETSSLQWYSSSYCVLDEAGEIQLEQRVGPNAKALREVFGCLLQTSASIEPPPAPP